MVATARTTTMEICEVDTNNKRQVRAFLDLPFTVYADCAQWVPPLRMDARQMLDRRRYPYYQHSDAAFFIAYQNDQPLGRIAVLENRRYNHFNHEKVAFFYLFEVLRDKADAELLFEAAFGWAQKRGLDTMIGPKGFTPLNGLGLLTRGFQHRPALEIPYNHAYYADFIEGLGFQCEREVLSGYLGRDQRLPPKIHLLSEKVQKRFGLRVQRFRTRAELRKLVPQLKELYNGSLVGTSGNAPLTDQEAAVIANQMLWFADPKLIKILFKDDQLVGFLFAYPDISAALQRTKGKLFPLGWADILRELKRTEWINVNGAGILEEYRGLGGTAILFSEMEKSILEGNFQHADLVQIGTENEKMQREVASLGIDFYKSHKIYRKTL